MSLLRPTMTSSFQCNILDGGHWEIDDIFSSPKHSATSSRNLNPETHSLPSWQMSFACVFVKFGQHKVISLLAARAWLNYLIPSHSGSPSIHPPSSSVRIRPLTTLHPFAPLETFTHWPSHVWLPEQNDHHSQGSSHCCLDMPLPPDT